MQGSPWAVPPFTTGTVFKTKKQKTPIYKIYLIENKQTLAVFL